jgi:hypothetical protein
MSAPVETKVITSTGGAGAGAIVAQFIDYLLGDTVYHHTVPGPVVALVTLVCAAGAAVIAGYWAPHTPKP